MKKRIALLIALLLIALLMFICTPLGAVSTYVDNTIKVLVNGSPVSTQIVMNDGSVFVPLRFMSNQLDAQVKWDSKNRTVTIMQANLKNKPTLSKPTINGSSDFENEIKKALALIPQETLVNNLSVIQEVSLANKPKNSVIASTNLQYLICNIDFEECVRVKSSYKLSGNQFSSFLAGVIVHESHHAYAYSQGLFESLSTAELEVLAFSKQRQILRKLNAPQSLIQAASADKIIDTNYYNNTLN